MKKILIINGHSNDQSFNYVLAASYEKGALQSKAKISRIDIAKLNFNPNLEFGYQKRTPLEPDLLEAIDKIKQADHIVWFFPMWWYGTPALLKGFIDRTFLPGVTFKYQKGKVFPNKLLKGKTSRMVITSDTVSWFHSLVMKKPVINHMKKGVLEFCGIKPVKTTYLAPVKSSSLEQRKKWLFKIGKLGEALK